MPTVFRAREESQEKTRRGEKMLSEGLRGEGKSR